MTLDQCQPYHEKPEVQKRLLGVFMPLRLVQWESLLASHPDRDYVDYILRGIKEGFRIGFKASGSVSSVRKNMHSAMENPQVVSAYIAEERKRGVLLGPFVVDVYMGSTGDALCPVAALLAYLAVRGGEYGPLFRLKDGRSLTREIFTNKVRAALSVLGYDSSVYAGHSFRIGAATTAAEQGIEDSAIKCWADGRVLCISCMCGCLVKCYHLYQGSWSGIVPRINSLKFVLHHQDVILFTHV